MTSPVGWTAGGHSHSPRSWWIRQGNARRERWLLAAVLVLYVILAAWYSVTIPLGEAPDEVPHFTYVRYLAQHGRLPTTEEEHEAFQPPLYYALSAAVTFWAKDETAVPFAVRANADFDVVDPRAPKNLLLHTAAEGWPYRGWVLAWHLVRLVSIACGAVTVWAVYRLGRTLVPCEAAVPLAMAALTAFTPQFLFMSAVANNDNAAVALSAVVLWQVAAVLHKTNPARLPGRSALLGLLVGLGVLTKVNLLALAPIAGLAIVAAASLSRGGQEGVKSWVGLAARSLALATLAGLAVAGWYFVRNWRLFGDPLGWSFLLQINARREGPLTAGVLLWLAKGVFRSFWLGWIGIAYDEWIYWAIGVMCALGLGGFVLLLCRRWRALSAAARWTLGLLGLHAALTLGLLVQWTATVLGTDQGRLIFSLLPTVMLVLVTGWAQLADLRPQRGRPGGTTADALSPERTGLRGRRAVLIGLVAGMFALAVLTPLLYIAPVHAPARAATAAELAAATPLDVRWDAVRLLGYRLESSDVRPGDKIVLDLYWQGDRAMDRDIMALIQLVDGSGKFLMYTDGSPTAGRDTTDRWPPGVPLASRHLLPVPAYGQPGDYGLTISLHPFGDSAWLTAVGADGTAIGDQVVLPETIRLTAQEPD